MYRNIGPEERFVEIQKFGENYKVMYNKTPVVVADYKLDSNGNQELDENGNPIVIGYHNDDTTFTWIEETYIGRMPNIDELKISLYDFINTETKYKITNNFVWTTDNNDSINLYLSLENQLNYKSIFDIASIFPDEFTSYKLKYGDTTNIKYYEISTANEYISFYKAMVNFINSTIDEGNSIKDSIDWSKYIID